MRRTVIVVLAVISALGTIGASTATAGPKPTHGCDQALENDGDVYDSTCDGSPSENGNEKGNATGKPCAGCVGAADNKNPKGQLPGPEDKNNGYECDGNNGIAKGNPAHTACEPYSGNAPTTQVHKINTVGASDRAPVGPTFPLPVLLLGLTLIGVMTLGGGLLRRYTR